MPITFHHHGWGELTHKRPIPVRCWDRFDLIAVHAGQLRLLIEEQRACVVGMGTAVLLYPHTRFSGSPAEASCRISVQHFAIDPKAPLTSIPEPLRRLSRARDGFELLAMRPYEAVHEDIRRSIALAFESQSKTVQAMRVALLTLILAQLETLDREALPSGPQVWDGLDGWLRQRLHRTITIEQMADHLDLSPSHFRHLFKRRFGTSPGRHLRGLRLQEAMRLLRETDLPIKTIARKMTYPDLPNFYRAFRAATDTSPAQYRTQYALRG